MDFPSWGRFPEVTQRAHHLRWRDDLRLPTGNDTLLPYGQGRSYGDCCLNSGGTILVTQGLNRFIEFDEASGMLHAESGVTLADILEMAVPRGWFLPVTPGTKFVSLGGAIANDVHGKNHHCAGNFGRYVKGFELLRSDGKRYQCSSTENADLYRATIAGLGLTGLITAATLQLKKIAGPRIDAEDIKFGSLAEFFEISSDSAARFEYTVAWLDCVSSGKNFGRGIFMRGNHADSEIPTRKKRSGFLGVPFNLPEFCLSPFTMRTFNALYYHKQARKLERHLVDYNPFFYPLDSVKNWNRIYGKRGLIQFQCVIPRADGKQVMEKILRAIVASGRASFLAVLKEFGDLPSVGMLSFPRPGITLALDFPCTPETIRLSRVLEEVVNDAGGALYPAKDALMQAESFQSYYPAWRDFAKYMDPRFSSSLWRRVSGSPV